MIVLAHMIEAEAPVLVFLATALGSAMRGRIGTARPLATRALRAYAPVHVRFDANTVINGRVEFHGYTLCELGRRPRNIDKSGIL